MQNVTSEAGALFREGKLTAAIEAANAAVRRWPADLGARVLLAELLLFAGQIERADVILDAAAQADPSSSVVVAEFRQLLRAETARKQLRTDGRLPEFLGEPSPALRAQLAAHVALRAGDLAEAARLTQETELLRPRASGRHDDAVFDDFRDADDLAAGYFEVLTTTGKYYWIPTERIATAAFHAPKRPRDLAWRRVTMVVYEGPEGDVYIPATYAADRREVEEQFRLGRATDWHEDQNLVRGVGQRVFLSGETSLPVMEVKHLQFGAGGT